MATATKKTTTATSYVPRFRSEYSSKIAKELQKELGLANIHQSS